MKKFCINKVTIHNPGWLTVYIADDTQIETAQANIKTLQGIEKVNITETKDLQRYLTVTVYPYCTLDEAADEIEIFLSRNI